MKIYTSKLSTLQEYFHPAAQVPLDDLMFISKEDPRWQRINALTERIGENDESIIKAFKKFVDLAIVANAFMSKGCSQKS